MSEQIALKRTGGPTITPLCFDSIFVYFHVYGCIRLYMAVYVCGHIPVWLYMAVYGCIWLYMAVYGRIWPYMGCIWQYIGWKWIANMMTVVKVTIFD